MNAFTWAILTALIWGVVPLIEKSGLAKVTPLTGLFFRSIGVVFGLIILSIFMVDYKQIKSVDLKSVALLMLGGFLASFVAQLFFYQGLKIGQVSKMVPLSGTYPLVAFVLGIIIFKESLTPLKVLGVCFISFGVWALHFK